MCQKSALQCQLTCLYALYTVNPSPLPPQSNTHCHESSENSLQNIPSAGQIININQLLHSVVADSVVQWIRAGMVWVRS